MLRVVKGWFSFTSRSPRDTQLLGRTLGSLAEPGDVFLLVGQLGAGKTCLVQGLARGLGVSDYVASPSFVLMREYKGRLPLYHVDLYRLENPAEIADLGLDDYFYGNGVSVVEWADRALQLFPPQHLLIEISVVSARRRDITLKGIGPRHEDLVSRVAEPLSRGSNGTGSRREGVA
ncbi:MAG: tRNA (adenosine(37)-N6)-threonylcarbamoyltransferase complex ATPase subunit type 1 TsaE [Chloroflexi bacterium]|nr:tRNA (adenosine(37)-N6)-threonylcarbamoyltransferase complex ATPase subunit type 1 TsaE [Chloroflexota bacterium]